MTRVKALCNDLSEPDMPRPDLYLPTPTRGPAIVSPPFVHRLDGSRAQIGGSTPIVHSLSLKSKSAFAKLISKAKEVRARRFH
jgi:hypothetical protein